MEMTTLLREQTMKLSITLLAVLLCVSLAHADDSFKSKKVLTCNFKQNRILLFEYSGTLSEDKLRIFVEKNVPPSKPGNFTSAYFFKKGQSMPRSGQTFCESLSKAKEMLYESNQINPWNYAFMQDISGKVAIINCKASPDSDMCRR